MLCQRCQARDATENFVGEGGALAFVHGFYHRWCRQCVIEVQLAYAQRAVERIPDLLLTLEDLRAADRQAVEE